MMDLSRLEVGMRGTAEIVVGEEHTAPRIGSGRVRVRSKDGTTKTLTRKWRVTVHPDGKVEVVPR